MLARYIISPEASSSWLKKQRAKFKRGKLAKSHQRLLEKLGVDLGSLKTRDEKWQGNIMALKCFIQREGAIRRKQGVVLSEMEVFVSDLSTQRWSECWNKFKLYGVVLYGQIMYT